MPGWPANRQAPLTFIESGVDPETGEIILVLRYADGTHEDERFLTESAHRIRLRELYEMLRATGHALVALPSRLNSARHGRTGSRPVRHRGRRKPGHSSSDR